MIKKYVLKLWLRNYYRLYQDGKTPTAEDVAAAIVNDLR